MITIKDKYLIGLSKILSKMPKKDRNDFINKVMDILELWKWRS
tara:strand:- start:1363 stop:1491 length:129 start_codon:yes stop_codon:yes gene_type:complete